ncbi:MAG: CDP-archaeol synthase [Nitrospinaceae bacterium]|nr:CDP-archaeol synthase [Nitrospinaceae bacterium]MBT3432585.1 CDP-archaeol synthase [Nitrospinaceae bacterium]MBT3822097.1 CDP-archaeol synthase [Nitrospinaceae bacterium]MBT4095600.1 CDP-archaeol synthase [Nitrospinaceae bacterium]MBT4429665.1 CDP-archaeol synthase [Nitrospinaceae bacterium]
MVRFLSAIALAVPLLLSVWYGPPIVFLVIAVIVALVAAWEFQGLLADCGWESVRWEGALDAGLLVLAFWVGGLTPTLALTLIFLRIFVRAMSAEDQKSGLAGAGASLLGLLWIGGACALVVMLRLLDVGKEAVLFLFAVVWANDIAAYYIGRAFGSRKLAPSISPGKTVEGSVGGLVVGVLAGLVVAVWLLSSLDMVVAIFVAMVVGLLSQVGDLCESFVKRAAGRKDSGSGIPGHGGILDRIDGLLLATPPFYFFLRWFAG